MSTILDVSDDHRMTFHPNGAAWVCSCGANAPFRRTGEQHLRWAVECALFVAGAQRKQAGQQVAAENAAAWTEFAREAVDTFAAGGEPFTSEDVLAAAGLPSGKPGMNRNNAVGALMTGAARRGVIVKTGRRVKATRAGSHAAELTEWVGA